MSGSKNKVVNIVNYFYDIVKTSVDAWIVLLENFIVYGWLDTTCYLTAYLMQPLSQRDSFTQFKRQNPINLKYRKSISLIFSIILFGWLACYIFLLKNGQSSSLISLLFIVLGLWLIFVMVYLSMFGLVWSNNHYEDDRQYYAQTFIELVHNPAETITILTTWIVMLVLSIRCFLLIFLILPGVIIKMKVALYKKQQEQKNK